MPSSDITMTLSLSNPHPPLSSLKCLLFLQHETLSPVIHASTPSNTCPFHGILHPVKSSRVHYYELSFSGNAAVFFRNRSLDQVGCVTGGGQMVRRLPDLSFRGGLIVSQSRHCETGFATGLHPLKMSKYLTSKTLDLTESKLFLFLLSRCYRIAVNNASPRWGAMQRILSF